MVLLLMAACLGLLALVVTALAYWAAARSEEPAVDQPQPEVFKVASPVGFFADTAAPAGAMRIQVPVEALLLQIENHVRLEQAAAESFLEYPTSALLHTRTISPIVN
ncbi:MAG TPA: hypothetical protein VN442_00960 [Bryobacteraceae bacterium]|nr:hypothetical protein [Bryobacteraceae bacterium]